MPHTDPEGWSRICDSQHGPGYVFRRGIELATDLVRRLAKPNQRWLDVGCGNGRLLSGLVALGTTAFGVDADPAMLELARQRLPSPPPLIIARADQLPFGSGTLDGITATSFMGCVGGAELFFEELRRVLRPEGHAVITFTNRDSWLLRLNYALSPRRANGYRLYRVGKVVETLNSQGFDVAQVRLYGFVLTSGSRTFPPAVLARRLECSWPVWRTTRIARNFIVVIRKVTP